VRQVNTLSILKNQNINESETTQNRMACMLTTFDMKTRTRIACWNVRTLLESSRTRSSEASGHGWDTHFEGHKLTLIMPPLSGTHRVPEEEAAQPTPGDGQF
jgi:hypothetical protein